MGKKLTCEIPDDVFAKLEESSKSCGRTVEQLVAESLRDAFEPKLSLEDYFAQFSEEERRASWEKLSKFAGSINSGDPDSANNDKIDADLAREYSNDHEEA